MLLITKAEENVNLEEGGRGGGLMKTKAWQFHIPQLEWNSYCQ